METKEETETKTIESNGHNLKKMFEPQSIAVIGATAKEGKIGKIFVDNLLNSGYLGKVYLINPNYDTLSGRKCYRSMDAISEEEIDLAIVIIPALSVKDVISQAIDRTKNFIVISAGFSEMGEEGQKREAELHRLAEEEGLNILGPNCLGFLVPKLKLNASFAGDLPEAGPIAFVSQSGALTVAIIDIAKKINLKFSKLVSIGNKMKIDASCLIEYLALDKNTKVVGLYLEGIKDGERFIRTVEKVSRQKPIVILKAGSTARSQKAISSHTGALAGDSEVCHAVCKKSGILQAENLNEFFNLLRLLGSTPVPKVPNVAIVTNAGGAGVLTIDAFRKKEIQVAELEDPIKSKLREFLPRAAAVENPVDILGDALEDRYEKTLEVLAKEEDLSIICILTPQAQTPVEKIAQKLIEFKNKNNNILITSFIGGERVQKSISELEKNQIINFQFPEQAVSSLDKYYQWQVHSQDLKEMKLPSLNKGRQELVDNIIGTARMEKREALFFTEIKEILDLYDIEIVETTSVMANEKFETELKYPVVLKVDSDKILHKTDKQGVVLDILDKNELREAISEMKSRFPEKRLIAQSMRNSKIEIIVGLKKDPNFGSVVAVGIGGIYTEILKAFDLLIPPADFAYIKNFLLNSRIGFLFQGSRGEESYNLDELAYIISKLISLGMESVDIKELDINPLFIYNDMRKAVVIDAKVII